jgi:cytochrome c553
MPGPSPQKLREEFPFLRKLTGNLCNNEKGTSRTTIIVAAHFLGRLGLIVVHLRSYSRKGRQLVTIYYRQRCIGTALLYIFAHYTVAVAQDPQAGATLYRQYCASCHGERGNGNGPVAVALTVKPSDLRTITARHSGEFPRELLGRIISGDEVVAAHGTRVMPIWGERLQEDVLGTVSKPAVAHGRIGFLVDYLETLQGTEQKAFDNVVLPTTGMPPGGRPQR